MQLNPGMRRSSCQFILCVIVAEFISRYALVALGESGLGAWRQFLKLWFDPTYNEENLKIRRNIGLLDDLLTFMKLKWQTGKPNDGDGLFCP